MKILHRILILNFLLIAVLVFFAYIRETPKFVNEQTESLIEKPINPATKPTEPYAGKCIITIDSQKYDVTTFRDRHSGGDIFNCGTNMTKIYYDQHSASTLKKMVKYKIS